MFDDLDSLFDLPQPPVPHGETTVQSPSPTLDARLDEGPYASFFGKKCQRLSETNSPYSAFYGRNARRASFSKGSSSPRADDGPYSAFVGSRRPSLNIAADTYEAPYSSFPGSKSPRSTDVGVEVPSGNEVKYRRPSIKFMYRPAHQGPMGKFSEQLRGSLEAYTASPVGLTDPSGGEPSTHRPSAIAREPPRRMPSPDESLGLSQWLARARTGGAWSSSQDRVLLHEGRTDAAYGSGGEISTSSGKRVEEGEAKGGGGDNNKDWNKAWQEALEMPVAVSKSASRWERLAKLSADFKATAENYTRVENICLADVQNRYVTSVPRFLKTIHLISS